MRALTLWQPWATLAVVGLKKVETRSWHPMARVAPGDWIAITASAGFPKEAREAIAQDPLKHHLEQRGIVPQKLPRGKLLGMVRLKEVASTTLLREAIFMSDEELAYGDYGDGRFGWVISEPRCLETPVDVKGAMGLWGLPEHLEDLLLREARDTRSI